MDSTSATESITRPEIAPVAATGPLQALAEGVFHVLNGENGQGDLRTHEKAVKGSSEALVTALE